MPSDDFLQLAPFAVLGHSILTTVWPLLRGLLEKEVWRLTQSVEGGGEYRTILFGKSRTLYMLER